VVSYNCIIITVIHVVRFQVLTVATVEMTWDIVLCSLIEVDRRFAMTMETVHTCEMMAYYNETTLLCIQEGCHLQSYTLFAACGK
jgi:hypothetical protein